MFRPAVPCSLVGFNLKGFLYSPPPVLLQAGYDTCSTTCSSSVLLKLVTCLHIPYWLTFYLYCTYAIRQLGSRDQLKLLFNLFNWSVRSMWLFLCLFKHLDCSVAVLLPCISKQWRQYNYYAVNVHSHGYWLAVAKCSVKIPVRPTVLFRKTILGNKTTIKWYKIWTQFWT